MKDLFPAWLLFNGLHFANSALEAVKCSSYPKKFPYAFPLFTVMVGFLSLIGIQTENIATDQCAQIAVQGIASAELFSVEVMLKVEETQPGGKVDSAVKVALNVTL